MTEHTELVQRLRSGTFYGSTQAMCDKAADAIEQQAAEIAKLRADAERMRDALQNARGALADISQSHDMTLQLARNKASRVYAETYNDAAMQQEAE